MFSLRLLAAGVTLSLAISCANRPLSFVEMGHDPITHGQRPQLTDALAINYADAIANYLDKKARNARITRETSNSARTALAMLASPGGEVFGFADRTTSVLGLT